MNVVTIRSEKGDEFSVDLYAIQMIRVESKAGKLNVDLFLVGKETPFTIIMLEKDRGVYDALLKSWIERGKAAA